MKCISTCKCQVRIEDKIVFCPQGAVYDFEKCPDHFVPIGKHEINFDEAGEEELLEADYDLNDLKAYIENHYQKKAGNKGKAKTVDLLLDCRFRTADLV